MTPPPNPTIGTLAFAWPVYHAAHSPANTNPDIIPSVEILTTPTTPGLSSYHSRARSRRLVLRQILVDSIPGGYGVLGRSHHAGFRHAHGQTA